MIWNPAPTESGHYHWRENEHGRVHNVRVTIKKDATNLVCKTMDLRRVMAAGEWCLKMGAPNTDPLDGLLTTTTATP